MYRTTLLEHDYRVIPTVEPLPILEHVDEESIALIDISSPYGTNMTLKPKRTIPPPKLFDFIVPAEVEEYNYYDISIQPSAIRKKAELEEKNNALFHLIQKEYALSNLQSFLLEDFDSVQGSVLSHMRNYYAELIAINGRGAEAEGMYFKTHILPLFEALRTKKPYIDTLAHPALPINPEWTAAKLERIVAKWRKGGAAGDA
jgi:hypothetical protein